MTHGGDPQPQAPLDRPIVCPVLLGRDRQLQALRDLAAATTRGSGQTVLVLGEAGIGKSRLVNEFATQLQSDAWPVVRGSCFERDRTVPYAPVAEMLRQVVGSPPRRAVLEQLGQRAVDLARILPELMHWLPPDVESARIEPEQDRRRLFQVVGEVLADRDSRTPTLLITEDVHWADDASLDLLHSFARTLPDRSALLLLTYRSDESFSNSNSNSNSNRALRQFRDSLNRARVALELHLAPLETADIDGMLRAILGLDRSPRRDFLELVNSLTEGNPFFVEELVRALIAEGQLIRVGGTWSRAAPAAELRLPRTVLAAVQRQSETLSEQTQRILEMAAVVGQRFDFEFVQALVGFSEGDFLATLNELIGAGLVIEVSADQLAFRHALTRQAILSRLLARERRLLHRRVAEAIEQTYASDREAHLADLAQHYHAAGLWVEALDCARRAGQHALRVYAPGAAAEQLTLALESAGHLGLTADPDLLEMRGRAREALGDFDGALADYTETLAAAPSAARRCQALMDLGALWASRDYAQAGEWFEQALEVARQTGDSPLLARALNRHGNWLVNIGRTAEALAQHHQALALLEPAGDRAGIAETVDLLGMSFGLHGDVVEAFGWLVRAADKFGELGDRVGQVSSLGTSLSFGGPLHAETSAAALRSLAEIRADGGTALRLAQQSGSLASEAYVHLAWGHALNGYGELGEALEHGRAGQKIATEIEHQQWQTGALNVLGEASVFVLAAEDAIDVLEQALGSALQLRSCHWTGMSASYLALAYLQVGDLARARSTLLRAWSREHLPTNAAERRVAWVWGELALAERDPQLASRVAQGLLESVPGGTRGQGIPWLHKLLGEAQRALGRLDDALASLELSKAGALARQQRPALWQIHRALARLHLRRRSAETAYAEIEQATACIEAIASTLRNDEFASQFRRRALSTLPGVPNSVARRIEMRHAGGLSPREREVAEQVALGRSNREIADALIVGERTVETHVANIMSKLGLSSRRQIANWLSEHDTA
jgi:DNA-binding CsgD family transcriptional regulator/tetratricopeptide (TPR) repeat protein